MVLMTMSFSAQAEWWNDPKIKQSAGLSDKQVEEMNKIFATFKEKRNEAGAKFRSAQTQLGAMLAEEKLDEAKIRKTLDETASLHSQAFKEMAMMKLEVRKLLTSEQLKKILAEHPDIFSTNKLWTARGLKAMRPGKSMMKKTAPSKKEKSGTTTPSQGQGPATPAPAAPSGGEGSKK
jgi:Spy/CpxP family protein refolding chaperone